LYTYVYCSNIDNSQATEIAQREDEGLRKCDAHIYRGILFIHKEE
jgi:hypothetical protein